MLCLHREDASHGFDAREIDLIRRISPHVAEGLRRAVTIGPVAAISAEAAVPGMIVLDANLAVVSMSHEAEQWLAEIGEADWPSTSELPFPFTPPPPGWSGWKMAPLLRSRPPRSGFAAAPDGGCHCTPPACAVRPRRRSAS